MGYKREEGSLDDLFPEKFITSASEEITDNVGDQLRDAVAKRTPVARVPQAYHADFSAWIKDRGGRTPRTMRDSWRRSEVHREDDGTIVVEVFSDEPVIDAEGRQKVDFVEEDTKPHLIRAKRAKRLRFPQGPSFRYAIEVHHPGTQGVHMVRDSEAEFTTRWEQIAERVLPEKESEYSDR